ncbi:MAG: hypothetical protein J6J00_10095 [Treponema sp.]|nr:hypothetical protein [Treponema sp.]
MKRYMRISRILLFFLLIAPRQNCHADAFNGKGIFSFDFSYMGAGLQNNGWGLGFTYEHGIMNFASLKGSFSHVSLKPDLEHDWITSVGLGLNARIYPFNKGMNMLYLGYGIGTDFVMYMGEEEEKTSTYISHCPHLGWKQNFLDYVMLEAYIGYRIKTTEPDAFALECGISKHGVEYGITTQLNIKKIWQWIISSCSQTQKS